MNWNVDLKWDSSPFAASQNDLARFVINQAMNPYLDKILTEAKKELTVLTPEPEFDGYLSKDRDKAHAQVKALYNALLKHEPELSWTIEPKDQFAWPLKQYIRTPEEVFKEQSADCIDIVCLLASILLKIGLNPLITIAGAANNKAPTHAILGYWLEDKTFPFVKVDWDKVKLSLNSIAFVNVTGVLRGNKKPFVGASAEALASLPLDVQKYIQLPPGAEGHANQFLSSSDAKVFYMVDVRRMYLEDNVPFPVIAIMGTKGGVGKTTIAARMAELIAETNNNVLIIDLDVEGIGSTRFHCDRAKTPFPTVKTVWDYLLPYSQGVSVDISSSDERLWDVTVPYLKEKNLGKIYLLPACPSEWTIDPYNVVANIPAEKRNEILLKEVNAMLQRAAMADDDIGCVIIDCGAQFNPLVSAALYIANYGYVVAIPDSISFNNITDICRVHQARYPKTDVRKIRIIVNRTASDADRERWAFYHPVGFIPDNPDLQKHFFEDSLYFDLGYDDISLEIQRILVRTLQGKDSSLVPNEVDVWIAPWMSQIVERQIPEKMLKSVGFKMRTFFSHAIPLLALVGTFLTGYLYFHSHSTGAEFVATRFATAFGFLLFVSSISMVWFLNHRKKRKLLLEVNKKKYDKQFLQLLLQKGAKGPLNWLRGLLVEAIKYERQELRKQRC
jgi:cellulose biosynthesis protein BcsQ